VPTERREDRSLFADILHALETLDVPYAIVGAFAAAAYGAARATYDVDIVVDLSDKHIQSLVARYPPPRYYADPQQMRKSIRQGIMFNIIDGHMGQKADLLPVTMNPVFVGMLARRTRLAVEVPGGEVLQAWCASPSDVVIGKLMAWAEGRSKKHETDIYDMLVFHFLELDLSTPLDEAAVDAAAETLGPDVAEVWARLREAAREEAGRQRGES
jgi:hypothetical protein